MLLLRNKAGEEEFLADFKTLTRNRKVNGEKMITVTAFPTKANLHAFPLLDKESVIEFDGEEYVIKKLGERTIGKKSIKQVSAIHKFFVDMIGKKQRKIHNGSMTFAAACQFVFENSGYTFVIIDSFAARAFENFGNKNRLVLLQTILERYGAEMEIVGKQVRLRKKIGNDTDFQFRYGHNIKTFSRDIDTTNLATYIEGTGAEGIKATYISPNAEIFGIIDADEDVEDERFTSKETLLEEMKSRLIDEPEASFGLDFVDLRVAGYPYTAPNEGDRVFVIYEPMDNLELETRIMEIDEEFDVKLNPITTKVTLANHRKTFAGTMFGTVNKALKDIVNEDGMIRYNVLDEAVRLATEAIKSAQTELDFTNGITGVDKEDPNLLTRFTSRGIGVSSDGGNTFPDALTGHGVNTQLLTAGAIHTNNVAIIGDSLFFWDGSGFHSIDPDDLEKFIKISGGHIDISKGAISITRPDGYVVMNNGLLQNDFSLQPTNPTFRNKPTVSEVGVYWATTESTPQNCEAYSFAHKSRYLKMTATIHDIGTGKGARISIVDLSSGETLAQAARYGETHDVATSNPATLTVDLGIPDGALRTVYIKLNTTVGGEARGRINRIWLEQ